MAAVDEHDQHERRRLHQGFGASLSNAFEIALIPAVFAGFGWLVDQLLGTGWILATAFGLIGLLGTLAKLYYRYTFEMTQLEAAGPWARAAPPSGDALRRTGQAPR